jgi:hypothetical protein
MIINIANHGGSIVWDGVYYFSPSDYPEISDWEMRNLLLFLEYEKTYHRKADIVCEDKDVLQAVTHAIENPASFLSAPKPDMIAVPACVNCKKGACLTDLLCHTTEIKNVRSILKCGKLLSAVNARGVPGEELAREQRNGAKDTPDYFDYIMFSWGNCFAGDSLVMERMLRRSPSEHDFSVAFKPGVRFYFRYDDIVNHPAYVNDGHHPAKVKDELILSDYLHCCIIPKDYKAMFETSVPSSIANKVYYIENDCNDIWEWSEKVYDFARAQ